MCDVFVFNFRFYGQINKKKKLFMIFGCECEAQTLHEKIFFLERIK
jgi:hypothetical protein